MTTEPEGVTAEARAVMAAWAEFDDIMAFDEQSRHDGSGGAPPQFIVRVRAGVESAVRAEEQARLAVLIEAARRLMGELDPDEVPAFARDAYALVRAALAGLGVTQEEQARLAVAMSEWHDALVLANEANIEALADRERLAVLIEAAREVVMLAEDLSIMGEELAPEFASLRAAVASVDGVPK